MLISAFTEIKGKVNLDNVEIEFQYTKDLIVQTLKPTMQLK